MSGNVDIQDRPSLSDFYDDFARWYAETNRGRRIPTRNDFREGMETLFGPLCKVRNKWCWNNVIFLKSDSSESEEELIIPTVQGSIEQMGFVPNLEAEHPVEENEEEYELENDDDDVNELMDNVPNEINEIVPIVKCV